MAPALQPVERERVRRRVIDALDRISARKPREKVMERALLLAKRDELPETTQEWVTFIQGPLDEATRAVLGNPAAEILFEALAPTVAELEPERQRLASAEYAKTHENESEAPESTVRRPISGAQELGVEVSKDTVVPKVHQGPRLAVRSRGKRLNTLSYKEGGLGAEATGNRVLVVDDDPSYRAALARTLGSSGYEVSTAPDRKTALWMYERLEPRLILTDYELCDGGTGLDLAQTLHAKLGERTPPIVLVTASTALPKAPIALVARVLAKNETAELLNCVDELLKSSSDD